MPSGIAYVFVHSGKGYCKIRGSKISSPGFVSNLSLANWVDLEIIMSPF